MSARVIREKQRAFRAFARLHVSKVLFADELRERFDNRHQQRFGVRPASLHRERKTARGIRIGDDHRMLLVALQHAIQRFELGQILRR